MADEFVKGLDDLVAEMRELAPNVEKDALRTATFRGAQFLRDRLKEAAPVGDNVPPKGGAAGDRYPPGTLKKSFKAKRRRGTRGEAAAGVTGAWYAALVERGHTLKSHRPGLETIGHVPANPFIRAAFEANKEAALEEMKRGLLEGIRKRMDRLRARMPR